MANNLYTTKTAALKATKADINNLNAKKVLLNGKNIEELWGLNLPQDYPKFVTRCDLPLDKPWKIYDDNCKLMYYNLPNFLTNGHNFFENTSFDTFNDDISFITNGQRMFIGCNNLTTFNSDLPVLDDGTQMFSGCGIQSWNIDLPSLTNGQYMFYNCNNLTSFSSVLSSLSNGDSMFNGCNNLTSFSSDLPSLTYGHCMFRDCNNLTSFSSDLPSLTDGERMFYHCSKLTSFISDLSSMTDGHGMFEYCTNLTSFTSDLSSLTNGTYMFDECKLDTASVQNIADTIKDVNGLTNNCSEGIYTEIRIGIGNSSPNTQEDTAFKKIASKGWTVLVNGSEFVSSSCSSCCATCCASLTTLDETDGEFVAPIPYWAKPVPSVEQHARYVDSEGNFYNILGAQFIYGDNLETYGMFTSEEDAAANMRLKKIGEEEIETA